MKKPGLAVCAAICLLCISCSRHIGVAHETEEVTFRSGRFELAGALRIPENEGRHPLVILVHGDGYATRNYHLVVMNSFLRAGYACFSWDKPGCGGSKGELSKERRLSERTSILVDAFNFMKHHAAIDSTMIGFWGISQAGYVMPPAVLELEDAAFLIAVGCPAANGIDQTGYLIRKQLLCEGSPENDALLIERHFRELFGARTYQEYLAHAAILVETPLVKKMGFVSGIWAEDEWKPHDPGSESFFDPVRCVEKITIPALIVYGEKDTQADPFRGAEEYRRALTRAGNGNFRVELIPNADHDIILCETGCISERERRSSRDWSRYAPDYLELMEGWLQRLSGQRARIPSE